LYFIKQFPAAKNIPVITCQQNKLIPNGLKNNVIEHASSGTVLGIIPHLPAESKEFFVRKMLMITDTTYTQQTQTQPSVASGQVYPSCNVTFKMPNARYI
jgi:hypothetical protein